ncbi:uncharacterized protein BO95DRAFT_448454 [Aspergillus brunneoviolaceus CBS 621.78]|uniref:Uncharacterized protein n=1 Tax=Aspergillus brunneoviolaceus CBS 621.78 TaxID=1450534 RepID=A0ACD1FS44_9EURO|nr:hypothetical protein BO95DRAFT_448454 [Aspergillus brunneoviolaceus CBS 621.78]RAH39801.1 hypothetical protein BO95DRAFT_448454 [Aspergillus brunneoviolaceus CBS 621.78]
MTFLSSYLLLRCLWSWRSGPFAHRTHAHVPRRHGWTSQVSQWNGGKIVCKFLYFRHLSLCEIHTSELTGLLLQLRFESNMSLCHIPSDKSALACTSSVFPFPYRCDGALGVFLLSRKPVMISEAFSGIHSS